MQLVDDNKKNEILSWIVIVLACIIGIIILKYIKNLYDIIKCICECIYTYICCSSTCCNKKDETSENLL